VYGVKLYKNGIPTWIWLDEKIPAKHTDKWVQNYGRTKNRGSEIWVQLIEKAYAKLYRSFGRIGNGGQMFNALRDLTGAPSHQFSTMRDDMWDIILDADKRGYVIASGCSMSRKL
jgi:calpain-15